MKKAAIMLALGLPMLLSAAPVVPATIVPATVVGGSVASGCSIAALAGKVPPGSRLTRAELVKAGPPVAAGGTPNGKAATSDTIVGEHCLLQGRSEERIGAHDKPYAIGFELRVPLDWNGRLLYQGGAGLDGVVSPAMGGNVSNGSTAKVALARGFAVVSTDGGHTGQDAAFAEDQQAKTDFAYAAIGKVATLARRLVVEVAGRAPDRTYFEGCSNGGREAMIAAQRFPTLFDGVVAGDPAFHLSAATVLATFSQQTYRTIAPQGPDGKTILAAALTDRDVTLLSRGVLAQCDALDGAKDGLIFDHAACRFDPAVLACKPGQAAGTCIDPGKVAAIATAFRGPQSAAGMPVASSWVYDAGIAGRNWRQWQTGIMKSDGTADAMFPGLIADTLLNYFNYPKLPSDQGRSIGAEAMMARIAPSAAMTDATSTLFSTFRARGGKMLMVTGWSDPIFTPNDLIAWYGQLDRDSRAADGIPAADFARLFLVPGMNHCGGGPALDDFDALTQLVNWVEKGRAPERFDATGKSFPGITRPLCAFPKKAQYDGKGPMTSASSFVCA